MREEKEHKECGRSVQGEAESTKSAGGKRSGMYRSYGILLLSALFIGTGIARGEAGEVLRKAVNICLECIGVG